MSKIVRIKPHVGRVLQFLGNLYNTPSDALKEHISNAIDEHKKAQAEGKALNNTCKVKIYLEHKRIVIEYPYGMTRKEFEEALERVADSLKPQLSVAQIGQLGIGMFSVFSLGRKAIFFSRGSKSEGTFKVIIEEGSEKAVFEDVRSKDRNKIEGGEGIRIEIENLKFDPTKSRGPLSPEKLSERLGEFFSRYLREELLEIEIYSRGKVYNVQPPKIELPPIGESYRDWHLRSDFSKKIKIELYFDPSGKGKVSISQKGVIVVKDFREIQAYGLEDDSIYASGYVTGTIEADFLNILPTRQGFETDDEWLNFLNELDRIEQAISVEVEEKRREYLEKKLSKLQRVAIELVTKVLNGEEFKDLDLLFGGKSREGQSLPPNGFAFSPSSLRIDPGEEGKILLKAIMENFFPDTPVHFEIDNDKIKITPEKTILSLKDAKDGIVSIQVRIKGEEGLVSAVLTATAIDKNGKAVKTQASIRIGPQTKFREVMPTGINYDEVPFEDEPSRHSRYDPKRRTIEINTLHPDYQRVMQGKDEEKLRYIALLLGKENIVYNDKMGISDELFEKFLTFYFQVEGEIHKTMRELKKS